MVKLFSLIFIIWIIIYSLRIVQIGGIDPTYKEEGVELFEPIRIEMAAVLDKALPYPQSALLSGMVLGSQEKLPFYLKNELKVTSTIHMVVVSGQNLTILAGFMTSLAGLIGRKKAAIMTLCVIVFYSLITGFQIPVLRAALMAGFTFLAQLLGKEKTSWWILLLTAGLMLIYNPNWLLNISFQLSFLATCGVVVVAPILLEHFKRFPQILRQDLAVTLAAQALVLPVIVYNFYQFSAVGVLANLLVLWTVPVIMITGFIILGLSMVNVLIGQIVGLVPGILLTYFIYIVNIFSKIPGASLSIGGTSIIFWMGYYLLLIAGVWSLTIKQQKLT